MKIHFSGFDAAWGDKNRGAICEMSLMKSGALQIDEHPVTVTWDEAVRIAHRSNQSDLHVWAIDMPLVVANQEGCRPVERVLGEALAPFGCGAYPSNLSSPFWRPGASIWRFLDALEDSGFLNQPMSVPGSIGGKFYFECYPHPALIGLFDLDGLLKYKVRKGDQSAWTCLIDLLRSLVSCDLPIANILEFVPKQLQQTKENEDVLDAIICSYVAAYWWKFGTHRSTMIGDVYSGYMVTPHSERTARLYADSFGIRRNGGGSAPRQISKRPRDAVDWNAESEVALVSSEWSEPVELQVNDPDNIWQRLNPWLKDDVIRSGVLELSIPFGARRYRVIFVPYRILGQKGMKPYESDGNLAAWESHTDGASNFTIRKYKVKFRTHMPP